MHLTEKETGQFCLVTGIHTSSAAFFQSSLATYRRKKIDCISTQMVSPVQSPFTERRNVNSSKRHLRSRQSFQSREVLLKWLPLTHDAHFCCEHQGHADGEANEVVAHQIAQSTDQLFSSSPEDAARHALDTANTTSHSSSCAIVCVILDLISKHQREKNISPQQRQRDG